MGGICGRACDEAGSQRGASRLGGRAGTGGTGHERGHRHPAVVDHDRGCLVWAHEGYGKERMCRTSSSTSPPVSRGGPSRSPLPMVRGEKKAGRRRADVVAAVAPGAGVGRAGGTDDKAKVTVRMGCGPTTPTTSSRFSCCAAPMGSRHFPGRIAGRRGGRWHGTTRRPLGHENYRRLAFSLVPGNGFIRATVMAKLLQGKPFRIGGF